MCECMCVCNYIFCYRMLSPILLYERKEKQSRDPYIRGVMIISRCSVCMLEKRDTAEQDILKTEENGKFVRSVLGVCNVI